jgi:Uma2 family endonuclease
VVQPDLCIICDDSKIDERGAIGAPDLVIEIYPGNSNKEMKYKFDLYEEAGVLEYWTNPANQNGFYLCSKRKSIHRNASIN